MTHDIDDRASDTAAAADYAGVVAVFSHRLLNLLSVVEGSLELLHECDDRLSADRRRELLGIAGRQTAAATQLLDSLVRGVPSSEERRGWWSAYDDAAMRR